MHDFNLRTFPTLTTPRLILREVTPADAEDVFSYSSDPEVQKYDSDEPMVKIEEALEMIEKRSKWYASGKAISWGIYLKEEQRVIGWLGFYFWDREYYKTELGYTVARPYWRRGIATEALRAVIQFGFETMHLHRINVDTRTDNLASMRLMQKLGFYPEGVRRECVRNGTAATRTGRCLACSNRNTGANPRRLFHKSFVRKGLPT